MATRSLTAPKISLSMSATVKNTLTDATSTSVAQPVLNYAPTLASGFSAGQTNRGWQSKSRVLYNGGAETLDLYDMAGVDIGAGAGLDGVGQAIVFEEIVAIAIVNDNAVTAPGLLQIEPSSSNGFTALGSHTVALGGAIAGQGCVFKAQPHENGFNITDASNHNLKMTAIEGPVTYSIYILARHDDDESSSSSSSSSSLSSSSLSSSSSSSSSSISTSSISTSSSSQSTSSSSSSSQSTSSSSASSSSSSSSSSSISTSSSSSLSSTT